MVFFSFLVVRVILYGAIVFSPVALTRVRAGIFHNFYILRWSHFRPKELIPAPRWMMKYRLDCSSSVVEVQLYHVPRIHLFLEKLDTRLF